MYKTLSFGSNEISLERLSNVERLFSLSISCNSHDFASEIKSLYLEVGDDVFWKFSNNEKSASIASKTLQKVFDKNKINEKWIDISLLLEKRISLYMNELDKIAEIFDKKNIKVIALKNSGIARGIFKDYSSSPMGDIDLLVKKSDFFDAHNELIKAGYLFSDRSPFEIKNINQAYMHGGSEYCCQLSNGEKLWIELQFRSVAGRWIQPSQEPTAENLFKRAIPIDGSLCKILSPEDNLLQVCLHTAKHSFVRSPGFRLHTDVDRIVTFNDIKWNDFCNKVEKLHVKTPIYIALLLAKNLLRTNIPDRIMERLNFSPTKHLLIQYWLVRVGLFSPEAKKWNKFGYILFNIILFDSFKDFFKAIFPQKRTIIKNHSKNKFVFLIYIKRIFDLIFKRSNNI
ncbi:nucleotidyltransferase family protein [Prochlorococcus sp. AH-716-J21]|nr:nucleotidyltransferase family protein [Prochlorococcus sp. AH-716-J21]